MSGTLTCFVSLAAGWFVAFQEPEDGLPPLGSGVARARVLVPGSANPPAPGVDAEGAAVAGLAEGSRPEVLTWDRAYALALIRARAESPSSRGASTLDPAKLGAEAKRLGVADFARFRGEFLGRGGDPRPFRDPAPAMLEVLRLRQAVEDAERNARAHQRYVREAQKLSLDETSGMTPLMVDRIADVQQRALSDLAARRRRFRDALDALKVELGLSAEAPALPDRSILAAFGSSFDAADAWLGDPNRQVRQLDAIGLMLPELDDIAIEGRSLAAEARGISDRPDDLLQAAARVARANRAGEGDDEVTLRVRRDVRLLEQTYQDYWLAARQFILRVRRLDQALGGSRVDELSQSGLQDDLLEVEDRLVALWASFQARRLALRRDLGTLAVDDWPGFLAPLVARRGAAERR